MKTARYMTLAAVLLSLVAVAPVRADVSRAELQDALLKPYVATLNASISAQQISSTYGGLKIQVVNSSKQSWSLAKEVNAELQKPRLNKIE
jgi:hypothetical protein